MEQPLETEALSSPSGKGEYVPAMSHQNHGACPAAGAHVERLQPLSTIGSGPACCFPCQGQGGPADPAAAEITGRDVAYARNRNLPPPTPVEMEADG